MYRLFLALRYLRSRLVNLISIGGVMAGVAVLIVVVSIMDGFQERVRGVVRGSLSHIVLFPLVDAETPPPAFPALEESMRRDESHVVAAAPQIRMPVLYAYETRRRTAISYEGQTFHQMFAVGISWPHERKVSELKNYLEAVYDDERPFFHPRAAAREKTTVLISRTFAEHFQLNAYDENDKPKYRYGALLDDRGAPLAGEAMRARARELIGEEIKVIWGRAEKTKDGETRIIQSDKNLLITGVYDAKDAVEDLKHLYLEIGAVRKMGEIEHEYLQVNVKLDDYENAPFVQERLAGRYKDRFLVETWEDQRATFLAAVNQEKVLLVIVLSFIVLLGGFIILATLTLTVVEKTRDIGVIAALGAGRSGILSVFLWNGLLIGVIGALLGLGLGAWFTANVDGVKDFLKSAFGIDIFPPKIYHFRSIPTVWDWPSILTIMAGSVIVAFLAGLLPALRASRLDPIAALRYE